MMKNMASRIATCLCASVLIPGIALAKNSKPATGSWRIQQIELAEPLHVALGSQMTTVLTQKLVPESAVTTLGQVEFGGTTLAPGSGLFRVSTKQGTAWCAIEPLRNHPGTPKTSFGESLFLGRKLVQRRSTPCFADSDGDSRMDSAMIGQERGYVLPTIDKLGKSVPIEPFSVMAADAGSVAAYPIELRAELASSKDPGPKVVFSIFLRSGENLSLIDGFGLVGEKGTPVMFGLYGDLASIEAKFDDAKPALYSLGPVGPDGRADLTVTQTMAARNFGLGNPSRF